WRSRAGARSAESFVITKYAFIASVSSVPSVVKKKNITTEDTEDTEVRIKMAKSKTTSTINALLKLAAIPAKIVASDEGKGSLQVSVLVFEIGNEGFAIAVESVEGVVDCPNLTPLPSAPEGVIGVVSVRGRMT